MKIGVQTRPWWVARKPEQLPEVLAEVKAAGYDGVEIGSYLLDLSRPQAFQKLLVDHGLQVAGIHVGGQIWDPEAVKEALAKLEQTVAFAAAVGAAHVPFSGARKSDKTHDELARTATNLNRIGEVCRARGLTLAYHNHFWEIERDCRELRYIRDHTDPALVSFCLDVAWVLRGGGSPVAVAKEFLSRVAYFHLKDTRDDEWREVGYGSVDFAGLFQVMKSRAFSWAVVEQDETKRAAIESARMSRETIRQHLGV
jgi:sugar phosphate isomerase/epimerase